MVEQELLLLKGARIGPQDTFDWTPLHDAAVNGHTGVVELLLMKGALIGPQDTFNMIPLHLTAEYGHTGVVELLLKTSVLTESLAVDN